MLSPAEVDALLDQASELNKRRDFHAVAGLLDGLPRAELLREPELAYFLARAWQNTGREEEAMAFVQKIGPICKARGNESLYRRNRNLEGVLLFERGDVLEAESVFHEIVSNATAANDVVLVAHVTNNLGVIAAFSGRGSAALAAYARAAAAYSQIGDESMLFLSHHNLAMTYRRLGYYAKADRHFAIALNWARENGAEEELTFIEFERALLIHLMGDSSLAESTAKRALERAVSLNNARLEGEALRVLGTIVGALDRWSEARAHLGQALEIASSTSARLLEAEVQEELAFLEYRFGNYLASDNHARAAVNLYQSMGAGVQAARVLQRISGADTSRLVI